MTDIALIDDADELIAELEALLAAQKRFFNMPRSKQAAILCKDKRFQDWIRAEDEADAKQYILRRFSLHTGSRKDLDHEDYAVVWKEFMQNWDEYKRNAE